MSVVSRLRWGIGITTVFAILSFVLSLSSGAMAFAAGERIIQISSDPFTNSDSQHKTEVEPDSFAFGNTIVAAFQQGRSTAGASGIGFATSTNGGETFVHGSLPSTTVNSTPPNPTYTRNSDSTVAFDAKHNVWLISWLGIKDNGPPDVVVSRSTNGGLAWGAPVVVNASGPNDKNWTVCDNTPSSPHYGNCYTEYDVSTKSDLVQMSTSTDGGLTWGSGKSTADEAHGIGGQPLVQPDGTVIVPYVGLRSNPSTFTISSFKSTDGGITWSASTPVSEVNLHDPNSAGPDDDGGIRADEPLPSAEIDQSGTVYVTWSDCRFEANCNSNDLVLSTSSDGTTWSPVQRIPIDPIGSGVDHFIPGLGVDRTTSGSSAHLALAFYYFTQANCQLSACDLNIGFVSSINGGKSWSNKELLAGPMKLTWLAQTSQGRMVGDYISTSIAPNHRAMPVFAIAHPPTPATLTCGDPGSTCDEATFTTTEDLLAIVGGNIT